MHKIIRFLNGVTVMVLVGLGEAFRMPRIGMIEQKNMIVAGLRGGVKRGKNVIV